VAPTLVFPPSISISDTPAGRVSMSGVRFEIFIYHWSIIRPMENLTDDPCSHPEHQVQNHGCHIGSRSDIPGWRPNYPHIPTRLLFVVSDGFPASNGTSLRLLNDWASGFSHVSLYCPCPKEGSRPFRWPSCRVSEFLDCREPLY
jgi:hypothetical protein